MYFPSVFRPWRPSRFLDAFWSPSGSLLAPFGSLLASFGSPWLPFGSRWLPFGSALAPPWQSSAHFLLPLGAFSLHFAPPGTLSVRSGVLLVHFGEPLWAQLGFKWQPKCSQSRPSGTKRLQKSSPRLARFLGAFWHICLIFLGFWRRFGLPFNWVPCWFKSPAVLHT